MVSRKRTSSCSVDARDELSPRRRARGTASPIRRDDLERDLVQERPRDAEAVAVADRAAHHAAEDVLAPGAIGEDALGDEERRRARVVGDDAHRDVVVGLRAAVALARDARRLVDERAEQIGVVVARHALEDARRCARGPSPVSTHGLGSGSSSNAPAPRRSLELHEDEVPDLHPARAVGRAAPRRTRERSAAPSPWKKWISVHGPQGPVSPICQKLSFIPRPRMRSSPKPVTLRQMRARLVVGGHALLAAEDGDDDALVGQAVDLA